MLSKDEKKQFYNWAVMFFKSNRTAQSKDVFEKLKKEMPKISKKIEKAGKKIGASAYVGRYLLTSLAKEGWLINNGKKWSIKITPDRCTYCISPIDDLYLIDIDNNRYCSIDCFDNYDNAVQPYDSYWDDYISLFSEFELIYYEYKRLLLECEDVPSKSQNTNKLILTHIDLNKLIDYIGDILPDYDYILLNGGDDGPLAREMYRMVESIQAKVDHLQIMEDNIRKVRGPQKKYYSITINHEYLIGPGKKNVVLKKFIKEHRNYINSNLLNTWTTRDLNQRNDWWELLHNTNTDLDYKNTEECPLCGKIESEKYLRRSYDGYRYCEECYEYYDLKVK